MTPRRRLLLLSFTMLFVELALIRWTGSNILDLSHFTNFVLLGSFLGIGIGFMRSRSRYDLSQWAPVGLCALVLFVLAFRSGIDSSGSDLIFIGGNPTGLPAYVSLPIIFIAVAACMAAIGEAVGRVFATFEPLEAYSLDILGSLLGIAAFSLLSFLGAPPLVWGIIASVLLIVLAGRRPRPIQVAAVLALLVVLGVESTRPNTSWSPYYKITTTNAVLRGTPATYVQVNGIGHQSFYPAAADKDRRDSVYWEIYRRLSKTPDDVLIIGAGTGQDTAVALANGVKKVDAVEIDPRLYAIGREQNPDHPYSDPRVTVHVDDGRAFLRQTDRKYDLIVFALPDSLTLISGQSSLRLESYLFTQQSMESAREHLKPNGVFTEYNYYREQWLVDRLAGSLNQAYTQAPCVDSPGGPGHLALLMASNAPGAINCPLSWSPTSAGVLAPATDDHPFPYLRDRSIPGFYLAALALILLASLVLLRVTAGPFRPMLGYGDLFFMGAAFLLLETKNVVQFALLFGTTWLVNALVFAGILLSVYLAVQVARRVRLPGAGVLYSALVVSLVVAWLVPQDWLLTLAAAPRFVAAVTIAFTPIFIANLVFAERFRQVGSSTVAFATNLLGAIVGGVLEYGALITGYRSLLIVVGLLYGAAFMVRQLQRTGEPSTERAVVGSAPTA